MKGGTEWQQGQACEAVQVPSRSSEGAQWLWGMLRTWQQKLHTSAGLDLERGFKTGREGKREQQIVVMRTGEMVWLGEELCSHSLLALLKARKLGKLSHSELSPP